MKPEQVRKERERIKAAIKDLEAQIRGLKAEFHQIMLVCEHEFDEKVLTAVCLHCGNDFGWYCPKSPDHVCHTQCEVLHGDITLINGEKVATICADDEEGEEQCIFCGEYDERK